MFSRLTELITKNIKGPSDAPSHASTLGPYCTTQQLAALRWTVRTLSLPNAKRVNRAQTGAHQSRFRGRGMEFSEVRVYQPGDDVRSIDWRVTARRQKPHTKIFNEERERPLLIVCDQSQSQFFGSRITFKSVRAAEAAALFAWTALEHNDRVGGIIFSDQQHEAIKPARSRKSIMRMLNCIANLNQALHIGQPVPVQPFSFNDALTETSRLAKPGTLIVLISDFRQLDEQTEKLLSRMAKHNELLLAHTFDPLEQQLPPPGFYPVSDGQETLVLETQTQQARQDYQHWAERHRARLVALSQRYRAPYVEISTAESPLSAVQSILVSIRA